MQYRKRQTTFIILNEVPGGTVDEDDFKSPTGIESGKISDAFGTGQWQLVSYMFTIGADGTDVSLAFWADGTDDTLGGFIDDVQISAVPLPPAMLLFGGAMLGLGWLSRRRKAAASA